MATQKLKGTRFMEKITVMNYEKYFTIKYHLDHNKLDKIT